MTGPSRPSLCQGIHAPSLDPRCVDILPSLQSSFRFRFLLELSGRVTAHFALGLGVDLERAIPHHRIEDPAAVVLGLRLSPIRKSQKLLGKAEDIEDVFHFAVPQAMNSPIS